MPVSKLKNLAILILLLANLALALLVVPNRLHVRQETKALHDSLCSLYEQQAITLDPDAIPDTVSLYVLELKEDGSGSLQAARALLGENVWLHDTSTRYLNEYRSEKGSCSISQSGEFFAELTAQEPQQDLQTASRRLLKQMGFSSAALPEPMLAENGAYTVSATQQVLGMPVFAGDLVLTWRDGCLAELRGVFFPGANTLTRVSDSSCMSAADALVRFLSIRYELGWVGSAITGLQQGYIRSETAAAATVRLTPVWRLETDTGLYQINGMTGEVTPVS